MRAFWDRAAREDALLAVDDRGLRDAAFWAEGEHVVAVFEDRLGVSLTADTIVEIGCGVGRLTRVLSARADRVVALDVSPEMLALAREHNAALDNVEWVLGDGESLACVPDASAGGVFSHVVFQHIPDPAVTLGYVAEMGRVLQPGGWAAFGVSTDPRVHRMRLRGRREKAWRGSAVVLADLRETAARAGLRLGRVDGEGTQFTLVALRRADGPPSQAPRTSS